MSQKDATDHQVTGKFHEGTVAAFFFSLFAARSPLCVGRRECLAGAGGTHATTLRARSLLNVAFLCLSRNRRFSNRRATVKGAAKETIGHAIGNTRMEAEGNIEKNAGKVENKAGDIERKVAPSSGLSDNVAGMAHEAKGAVKESFGNLIGNDRMRAEGALERKEGQIQDKVGDIKRSAGQ